MLNLYKAFLYLSDSEQRALNIKATYYVLMFNDNLTLQQSLSEITNEFSFRKKCELFRL